MEGHPRHLGNGQGGRDDEHPAESDMQPEVEGAGFGARREQRLCADEGDLQLRRPTQGLLCQRRHHARRIHGNDQVRRRRTGHHSHATAAVLDGAHTPIPWRARRLGRYGVLDSCAATAEDRKRPDRGRTGREGRRPGYPYHGGTRFRGGDEAGRLIPQAEVLLAPRDRPHASGDHGVGEGAGDSKRRTPVC